MPEWLSTTLALVAGGLLTMLTGWVADRRLSARERERREDERRDRLRIRRSDFQRETLLALQVASQKLLRTTGAMNHEDVVAFRSGGRWQRQLYPDELSDGQLQQITEIMLLASRVHDDLARTLAVTLREQCASVGISDNEAQAQSRMTTAASTQQALIERIGHLVRTMDDAD